MHLTLKTEATKPAAANALQQQARFDAFIDRFNYERPHQALGMKLPGELYTRSSRPYAGLTPLVYPPTTGRARSRTAAASATRAAKINLSQVFAGQDVGVKQVSDRIWLVTFMDYISATSTTRPVGSADREPLRAESVTYVPGTKRHPCDRNGPVLIGGAARI